MTSKSPKPIATMDFPEHFDPDTFTQTHGPQEGYLTFLLEELIGVECPDCNAENYPERYVNGKDLRDSIWVHFIDDGRGTLSPCWVSALWELAHEYQAILSKVGAPRKP